MSDTTSGALTRLPDPAAELIQELAGELTHAADAPWARVVRALAANRALTTLRAYAADLRALARFYRDQTAGGATTGAPVPAGDVLAWVAAMETQTS